MSEFTRTRRQRTVDDTEQREAQLVEAKKIASRYLFLADLRHFDMATLMYLRNNDAYDDLRAFYDKKIIDLKKEAENRNLSFTKTRNLILLDAELNLEKDRISCLDTYMVHRRRYNRWIIKYDEDNEVKKAVSKYLVDGYHEILDTSSEFLNARRKKEKEERIKFLELNIKKNVILGKYDLATQMERELNGLR